MVGTVGKDFFRIFRVSGFLEGFFVGTVGTIGMVWVVRKVAIYTVPIQPTEIPIRPI